MPTPEIVKEIKAKVQLAEDKIRSWKTEIALMDKAQLDTKAQKSRLTDMEARLALIKSTYGV